MRGVDNLCKDANCTLRHQWTPYKLNDCILLDESPRFAYAREGDRKRDAGRAFGKGQKSGGGKKGKSEKGKGPGGKGKGKGKGGK